MSQFEYLGRVTFGNYLPVDSPIHRLNPGIKLAGFTLLILAITLGKSLEGLLAAIVFIILLLVISKVSLKYALRGLLAPLPFILIMAVLQVFLTSYQSGEMPIIAWNFLMVTNSGLMAAAGICLRFTGLVMLLTLSSATLSTLETVHGIDILLSPLNAIGIQTRAVAMVVQIMLRFIPVLALRAEKIAKSQASRGAAWGDKHSSIVEKARQMLPLILPLFSGSLQQADALAHAMLARGYGVVKKRTHLIQYHLILLDGVFLLIIMIASWLILFWPF